MTARVNGNGVALQEAAELLADFGMLWDRANGSTELAEVLEEHKRILGAVFDAVYVRNRELVAVQVRGPFGRLPGDAANHVRLVGGLG